MLILSLLMTISFNSFGEALSDKAVFYRCYRQLTQNFPKPNHPLVQQVEVGSITPAEACMQVLAKADFVTNGNNKISNVNDAEALAVLRTMQSLHYSWLMNKTLPNGDTNMEPTKGFVDINSPALYYTKALFTPNYQLKDIFLGTKHYQADREIDDPANAAISEDPKSDFPSLYAPWTFLDRGKLIGVEEYVTRPVRYKELSGGVQRDSTFTWDMHKGGGVLGSSTYIMMNLNEPSLYKPDGAKIMPRKWALSLIKDFLCREIPVIRYEDTSAFIVNNSPTEFRRDGGCIRCHATIDQTSSVIRDLHYKPRLMHLDTSKPMRLMELEKKATNRPSAPGWSHLPDADFANRPATGRFMYRTYAGQLVDQSITNTENLGQIFASLDDPYVCVAKRYYRYFTGIEAIIDDIGDPQYGKTLSANELKHRNEVINLGKNLKSHQSLKTLIKDIISKPQFKDSAYKAP